MTQVPGSISGHGQVTGKQTVRKAIWRTASWPFNRWLFSEAEYSYVEKYTGATRMRPHPCSEISLQWSPTARSPEHSKLKMISDRSAGGSGNLPSTAVEQEIRSTVSGNCWQPVFFTPSQAYAKETKPKPAQISVPNSCTHTV